MKKETLLKKQRKSKQPYKGLTRSNICLSQKVLVHLSTYEMMAIVELVLLDTAELLNTREDTLN